VRDYENTVGLNQRAAATAHSELSDPFGQRSLGRQGELQSEVDRGVAGGVAQQKLTGYDTETANQQGKIDADLADQNSAAGQGFSKTVGGIATSGIEKGIDTGTSQGWQTFLQGEAQKHPEMADKILGQGSSSAGGQ
jgi:hypothetical protein